MSSANSNLREPLVPTINFSMVCPGVYRSGYPTKKNYSFLCALRLRSILYLCPEDYAESNLKFCEENSIHVLRFPTEGNKEPFNDISEPLMHRVLGAICDTRNLPLLIHCNKGKHRTGTVVACLRHLQAWSLVSIFEEYKRFASDKARVGDQQYAELYHPIVKLTPPFVAPWVTITPRVTLVTSDRELMEAEMLQLGTSLLAPDKAPKKIKANASTANAGTGGTASQTSLPPPPPSPSIASAIGTSQPPPLPSTTTTSNAAAGAGAAPQTSGPAATLSLPPTPPPAQPSASSLSMANNIMAVSTSNNATSNVKAPLLATPITAAAGTMHGGPLSSSLLAASALASNGSSSGTPSTGVMGGEAGGGGGSSQHSPDSGHPPAVPSTLPNTPRA